jgi:4-amino-4-deoxy-L-arabinose transferase-like glycosyltransferase
VIGLLDRLSRPPFIWLLAALVPVAFLTAGLVRAAPFVDDVTPELSRGDDWLTYKRFAVSILEGGLSMPAVEGPYRRPGGFLYNYFLAGVFLVFGTNASYVYVVQCALLGLSVTLMFLAFRRYLKPVTGLAFLGALSAFMVVDVYRRYAFRLLSENLLVALLPAMFWLILRSRDRSSPALGAAAGVVAGLAFLTRPNLVLLGPAVAILLLAYAPPRAAWRVALPLAFAVAFFATAAAMPLRNHVASGTMRVPAVTTTNDWASGTRTVRPPSLELTFENVRTAANYYGRRMLFAAGLMPAFVPEYRVRPHWLAAWGGALAFVWIAVRRRRLEFWQALAASFVVVYLVPLIAVAMIQNYGFRMIVPALPAVILLAVYAGEQMMAVGQVRT